MEIEHKFIVNTKSDRDRKVGWRDGKQKLIQLKSSKW